MALLWTDNLVPDITRIKKKHIQELRDYLDAHIDIASGHPLATAGSPGFMSAAHYSLVENFSAEWVTSGNGVMTITTTLPIRTTGGANPTISIDAATTSASGSMSAADKTKLDNIQANANNYTHPATHPASIIDQDSTHRFVTDVEKADWNAKSEVLTNATPLTDGLLSAADKTKIDMLDGFPIGTVTMFSSVPECGTNGIAYYFNLAVESGQYGQPTSIPNNPFAKWRILTEMITPSGADTNTYRFPLAAGPTMPEKTKGGTATVKLKKEEVPKHRHIMGQFTTTGNNDMIIGLAGPPSTNPEISSQGPERYGVITGDGSGSHSDGEGWNTGVGAGQYVTWTSKKMYDVTEEPTAHENMPPYYSLYFIVKIQD